MRGRRYQFAPAKAARSNHRAVGPLGCTPRCKQPCQKHLDTDQFHVSPEDRPRILSPANKLQLAVLEDAMRTLAHAGTRKKANHTDFVYDVWWLEGKRPSAPGFSLQDICDALDLDYPKLRRMLTEMATKAHHEPEARRTLQAVSKPRNVRLSA